VSENRTTDAPRDPAFAAVARVLDAEKAFTAAVAVKDYSRDVELDGARAALAATVATTPAGLAVITGPCDRRTAEQRDEVAPFHCLTSRA
jgi:hypothetical protein